MAGQGRHTKAARLATVEGQEVLTSGGEAIAPATSRPDMPAQLDGDDYAVECWEWVTGEMERHGYLDRMDREIVLRFCQYSSIAAQAKEEIDKHGMVILTPNNYPVQSPYLGIFNTAVSQIMRLGIQFGWSPVGRGRLKSAQGEFEFTRDEFADNFQAMLTETAR